MKRFWQEYKFPISLFFIWRSLLFLLGIAGQFVLPFKTSFPYSELILIPSGLPQWLWQWANFDGVHYLFLAKNGYTADGLHVFFPVFPILVRAISIIIGNYLVAGILVANIFAFISVVLIYKFAKNLYDESAAKWSTLFFLGFPAAFFLGSVYKESLFLCLILGAFMARGVFARVCGFLAGATRLVGAALIPASFLAGLGLAAYVSYLGIVWHRPMAFLESQAAFKNARATSITTLVTPVQVTWRYARIFTTANPQNLDFWIAALEFASFYFGVGILGYMTVKRQFPVRMLLFCWAAILMPTLSGTFSSMIRYLVIIFPIYFFLAKIRMWPLKMGILGFFVILQIVLVILFTRGYFVA